MVERFNGRIASEVLGINVAGHADLEILLAGFNRAYNRRRQRVPRDKQDESAASIKMRIGACCVVSGLRATPSALHRYSKHRSPFDKGGADGRGDRKSTRLNSSH